VYLGLGSNLGDREGNLIKAVELLAQKVNVDQLSSIYETEPIGYQKQAPFLNAVCQVNASLAPGELLEIAKEIEMALGRVPSFPNAPRPIDIDILFYDKCVINAPRLIIPHPRLEERAFVLAPLAELAPNLVHPVSHKRVIEMRNGIKLSGVRKWNQETQNV
jgi:GTP cyclohydrolase-4